MATSRYGRTLADLFLLGYSRKLWGVPCDQLSPVAAGRRLQGLSVGMLIPRAARTDIRPSAHLEGRFLYPRHGIGAIADRLAESCEPGARHPDSTRVSRLLHENGRIIRIEINDRETIDTSAARVINTLPLRSSSGYCLPLLLTLIVEAASGLRFRHIVLVTVLLDVPSVSSNATIHFPEAEFVFSRARTRSSSWAARHDLRSWRRSSPGSTTSTPRGVSAASRTCTFTTSSTKHAGSSISRDETCYNFSHIPTHFPTICPSTCPDQRRTE